MTADFAFCAAKQYFAVNFELETLDNEPGTSTSVFITRKE